MLTDEQVIRGRQLLLAQVGKKYIFGYEVKMTDPDPAAFDCSELVQWLMHQLGYPFVDGSYIQFDASEPVGVLKPFDLGFYAKNGAVYHVGICFDDKTVIHAKNTNEGVVKEPLLKFESAKHFCGWRRPKCLLA